MPLGIIPKTAAISSASEAAAAIHTEGAGPLTMRRVAGDPTAVRQTTSVPHLKGAAGRGPGHISVAKDALSAAAAAAAAAKKGLLSEEQEQKQKLPHWILDESTDATTREQWWFHAIKLCASKNAETASDTWVTAFPPGASGVGAAENHQRHRTQYKGLPGRGGVGSDPVRRRKHRYDKHLRLHISSKSLQAPAARLFLKSLPSSLITISLRRCELTSSVISEMLFFSDLPHIKQLCLAGNQLTSVPLFLDHLPELQMLDLSSNLIGWGTADSTSGNSAIDSGDTTSHDGDKKRDISGNVSGNTSIAGAGSGEISGTEAGDRDRSDTDRNVRLVDVLEGNDGNPEYAVPGNHTFVLPYEGYKEQAISGNGRNYLSGKYSYNASLSGGGPGPGPGRDLIADARSGHGGAEGVTDNLLLSLGLVNARNPKLVYLNLEGNLQLNAGEHGEVPHSGYRDAVLSVMPNLLALDRHLISDEERVDNSVAFKKVLGLHSHDFLRFKAPFCAGHRSLRIPAFFYEEQKHDFYRKASILLKNSQRNQVSSHEKLALKQKSAALAKSQTYNTTGEHMLVASPSSSPGGYPGKACPIEVEENSESANGSLSGAYSSATLGTVELRLGSAHVSATDLSAAQRQKVSARSILPEQGEGEDGEDEAEVCADGEVGTRATTRLSVAVLNMSRVGTAAASTTNLVNTASNSAAASRAEFPTSVFNSQPTSQKLLQDASSKTSVGELFHLRYQLDGLVTLLVSQHRYTSPASIIQRRWMHYISRKRARALVTKEPVTRLQAHVRRWLLFAKCRAEFKRALIEVGEWEEPPTQEEILAEKRKRELAVVLARTNHLSTFVCTITRFLRKATTQIKRFKAAKRMQKWIKMLQNKWKQELHWLHRTVTVFQQYKNAAQTPLSLICMRKDLPRIAEMLKTIAIRHYRVHKSDAGVSIGKNSCSGGDASEDEKVKLAPSWELSWEPEVQEVSSLKRVPFKWVPQTLSLTPSSSRLAPSASLQKLFGSAAFIPKGIVDAGTFQSVCKGNSGGLPFKLVAKLTGLWKLCNAFVQEKKPAALTFGDTSISVNASSRVAASKRCTIVVGTMEWMRRAMRVLHRRGIWTSGRKIHLHANSRSSKLSEKLKPPLQVASLQKKHGADLVLIFIPMHMHLYRAISPPEIQAEAPVNIATYVSRPTMVKVRSKAEFFAAHRPSDAAHSAKKAADDAAAATGAQAAADKEAGAVKISNIFEAAIAPQLADIGVQRSNVQGMNLSIDSPGIHIMCRMLGELRKATGADTGTGHATTGHTNTWFFWDARRNAAAITVQSMWRGVYKRRVRSAQWLTRIIRKRAVICVQRWWRIRHYLHRRLEILARLTAICRHITKPVLYMDMWAFYKCIKAPILPHIPYSLTRSFPELKGVPHVSRLGHAVFKPVRRSTAPVMAPLIALPPASMHKVVPLAASLESSKVNVSVPALALGSVSVAAEEEKRSTQTSPVTVETAAQALLSSAHGSNNNVSSPRNRNIDVQKNRSRNKSRSPERDAMQTRIITVTISSPLPEQEQPAPEEKEGNHSGGHIKMMLLSEDRVMAPKVSIECGEEPLRVGFPLWAPFRPASEAFFTNKSSDGMHINRQAYEDEYAFAIARQETHDYRTGEKLPLGGTYRLFTLLTQGITVRARSLVLQKAPNLPRKDIQPGNIIEKGDEFAAKFVDARTDQEADVHVAELHFSTVQEARARCALLWISTYCATTRTGLRMMTEEALWDGLKKQCLAFKTTLSAGASARHVATNSAAAPAESGGVANFKHSTGNSANGKTNSMVAPVEAMVFLQSPFPLWCGVGANITQLTSSFAYVATAPSAASSKGNTKCNINTKDGHLADEWELARFRFLMTSLVVHSVGSYMNANVNGNAIANTKSIALAGQHASARDRCRSASPTGRLYARSPSPQSSPTDTKGESATRGTPMPTRPTNSPPTYIRNLAHRVARGKDQDKKGGDVALDGLHNPYDLPYLQYSDTSGLGKGSQTSESCSDNSDSCVTTNGLSYSSKGNSPRSANNTSTPRNAPQYWIDVDGTTRFLSEYLVDFDYSQIMLSTSLAEMESHASQDATTSYVDKTIYSDDFSNSKAVNAVPVVIVNPRIDTIIEQQSHMISDGSTSASNSVTNMMLIQTMRDSVLVSPPLPTSGLIKEFREQNPIPRAQFVLTKDKTDEPEFSSRCTEMSTLRDGGVTGTSTPRTMDDDSITMDERKSGLSSGGPGSVATVTVTASVSLVVGTDRGSLRATSEQQQEDGFESSRSNVPLSPSQLKLRALSPAADLIAPVPGIGVMVPRDVKPAPSALQTQLAMYPPAATQSKKPANIGLPTDNTALLPYHTSRTQAFVTASTSSVKWKTEATAAFLHDKNWTIDRLLLWASRGPEVSLLPFQHAGHVLRAPQGSSIISDRAKAFTMAAQAALTARIETLQIGLYEHSVRQSRYSATDNTKTLQTMQRDAKRAAHVHALDSKNGIYQQQLIPPSRKEPVFARNENYKEQDMGPACFSQTAPSPNETSVMVEPSTEDTAAFAMLPSATGTRMPITLMRPATVPNTVHVMPSARMQIVTATATPAHDVLDSGKDTNGATVTVATHMQTRVQSQSNPSSRPTTSGSLPSAASGSHPIVSTAPKIGKGKSTASNTQTLSAHVPIAGVVGTARSNAGSKITKKPIGGSGLNAVVALHLRKTKEEEIFQIQKFREAEKKARVRALHAQAQAHAESHLAMAMKGGKGGKGANLIGAGAGAGAGAIGRYAPTPTSPRLVSASPLEFLLQPQLQTQQPHHTDVSRIAAFTRNKTKLGQTAAAAGDDVTKNRALAKIGSHHGVEVGHDLLNFTSPRTYLDTPIFSNMANTILDEYVGQYEFDRLGFDVRRTNPNSRSASAGTARGRKGSPPRQSLPSTPVLVGIGQAHSTAVMAIPSTLMTATTKNALPEFDDEISLATNVTPCGADKAGNEKSLQPSKSGLWFGGAHDESQSCSSTGVGGGNIAELEQAGLEGPGSQFEVEELQMYHHTSLVSMIAGGQGDGEDNDHEELIALLEYSGGAMNEHDLLQLYDDFNEENLGNAVLPQQLWDSDKDASKHSPRKTELDVNNKLKDMLWLDGSGEARVHADVNEKAVGTAGGNTYEFEAGYDYDNVVYDESDKVRETNGEADIFDYVDHAADVMSDVEVEGHDPVANSGEEEREMNALSADIPPTDPIQLQMYHLKRLSEVHVLNKSSRINSTTASEKIMLSRHVSNKSDSPVAGIAAVV